MVPPVGIVIHCLKVVCRTIGLIVTPLNYVTGWLQRYQGYRHYGYQRYLSMRPTGRSSANTPSAGNGGIEGTSRRVSSALAPAR